MGLLITACTSRKRFPAPLHLRGASLPTGSAEYVATEWATRLRSCGDRVEAARLYAGRGFAEAARASVAVGGNLLVISAGLGAVRAKSLVPPYALSVVSGSPDHVLAHLQPPGTAQQWWAQLCNHSPFHVELAREMKATSGAILVALSEAYLDMVARDLGTLNNSLLSRLRIFTRAPAERVLPELRRYIMPYDDRLDGPDSVVRGTRGDFAPRAARHFAEVLLKQAPAAAAETHYAMVADSLGEWRLPVPHARQRLSDPELLVLLRTHWAAAGGQSSRLLRVLRDDLGVACEQGRFVGLMNVLRAEQALAA